MAFEVFGCLDSADQLWPIDLQPATLHLEINHCLVIAQIVRYDFVMIFDECLDSGSVLSEPAFRLLTELLVDPAGPGLRMDAATRPQREAFLARVSRRVGRL